MRQFECFRIEDAEGNLSRIGTVTVDPDGRYAGSELCDDSLVEEAIWDICNWWCWMDTSEDQNPVAVRKDGLFYERTDKDRGIMNSDLVIVTEGTVVVALPVGWEKFTNVQYAVDYRLNYEIPLFY
jgi:hypothetical protein